MQIFCEGVDTHFAVNVEDVACYVSTDRVRGAGKESHTN
jgi:hypothetical protein